MAKRRAYRLWSEREEDLLKKYYKIKTDEELAKMFDDRSVSMVRNKRQSMGLWKKVSVSRGNGLSPLEDIRMRQCKLRGVPYSPKKVEEPEPRDADAELVEGMGRIVSLKGKGQMGGYLKKMIE